MILQSRPRWRLIWLLIPVLLPFVLAIWQWQRGEARSAQLAQLEAMVRQPPQDLARRWQAGEQPAGQPVIFSIVAVGAAIRLPALLDGRQGMREWRAARLADGRWLVLDRGWLALPASFTEIPLPAGTYHGYWVARPQPYLLRGAKVATSGDVDALDWQGLAQALKSPLLPGLVLLAPTVRPFRPWPLRPGFDPQRHYAYAVQWLLLGICLSAGWFLLLRRSYAARSAS